MHERKDYQPASTLSPQVVNQAIDEIDDVLEKTMQGKLTLTNACKTLESKLKNQPELGFLLFSIIAPLHQDLKKALEYAENGLFSTLEHKETLENWRLFGDTLSWNMDIYLEIYQKLLENPIEKSQTKEREAKRTMSLLFQSAKKVNNRLKTKLPPEYRQFPTLVKIYQYAALVSIGISEGKINFDQ